MKEDRQEIQDKKKLFEIGIGIEFIRRCQYKRKKKKGTTSQ